MISKRASFWLAVLLVEVVAVFAMSLYIQQGANGEPARNMVRNIR